MSLYARRPCDRCGEPWSPRAFYERTPGCCKVCHKARVNLQRRQSPLPEHNHRVRDRAAEVRRMERWRAENPEKARAIDAVAHAVESYDLERPPRCPGCGTDKHVCGFHDDYAKPLAVTWSCRRCRTKARREAKAATSSDQATASQ
jgi:hypothetical protein